MNPITTSNILSQQNILQPRAEVFRSVGATKGDEMRIHMNVDFIFFTHRYTRTHTQLHTLA